MGKKVLIITGSPRANGNTNTLVTAFAGGAIAAGNEVEIFDAGSAKMDGCHADKSCEARGYCGLKDDGARMSELMRWADVMILASPVYWNGFTAQMKLAIDHFYQFSFPKGKELLTVKEIGLIATAAKPTESAFDCLVGEYDYVTTAFGFENRFKLLCPSLAGVDDIKDHPDYIAAAVKYGMEI